MTNTTTLTPAETSIGSKADVTVSLDNFLLTNQDRCDACGSQAYFAVNFSGSQLLFCRHDFKKNETVLLTQATSVRDESAQLESR